ncbi:hypothetical protein Patl_2600 [Paraglaciecola sp. T6c]|uniref:DUF6515 family protein n=1 Tax=Pseudoalteromonas atlantica (strain T6c / ATCC BAA-1087) TaxID=3042615 RepID=UPI00005C5307|nr:DUF6515 family protein [Paraglaciecola sp. T6c]ABG41115.1 hypothetical protein Patl_2600 [Paraglaciecola sp. T6c]
MNIKWLLPLVISLSAVSPLSQAQYKNERHNGDVVVKKATDKKVVNKNVVDKKVLVKKSVVHHSPEYKTVIQKNVVHAPSVHKPIVKTRVVYKTGALVRKAPVNSIALRFGGVSFVFHDGLYYRHVKQGYKVVRPPVGLRVNHLPAGYERIVVRGSAYYFAQGIYYVFDNGAYRVIDEPAYLGDEYVTEDNSVVANSLEYQQSTANNTGYELGKAYDSLPKGAEPVSKDGQQYFKYYDIYFLPQSSNAGVHYLAVRLD